MMPGMNPRMMKQAMKRMGIQQQEVEAVEVIIKTADKELVFENPQVSKVNMMGQQTYQIVGEPVERALETAAVEINEDDVKTVVDQTGVGEEKARELLEKNDGDIAATILELQEESSE